MAGNAIPKNGCSAYSKIRRALPNRQTLRKETKTYEET